MRRYLIVLVSLLSLLAPQAQAANSTVSAMTAATSVAGTDLVYCVQSAGTLDRKCTPAQIAAYIYGLTSGDATIGGTGAVTFATVNSNVGSFGSATQCITTTQNAKGLTTAISAVTCTPAIGSVTGTGTGVITALGINVGTAGSFVVNGGAGGTPSSITLTNGTGLPIAGLTGLGTGVATFLGTPSSANLAAAVTGETGSGALVFGTAPTISSLNATTAMTLAFLTGSTQCVQVSSTGVVSGTGAACGGSGSTGANPTATAGPTAVNGVATTFMRSDGAPAIQLATASQKGIVQVDGTTITATSGVISAVGGSGTVTSVAAGCGNTTGGSPITSTGTISAAITRRANTATTDTIVSTDCGNVVSESNASPVAATIAQAGTTGFAAGSYFWICNINAGAVTITPTTSTIGGASTLVVNAGSAAHPNCTGFQSDGTNYNLVDRVPGSGVAIASANALSSAGGLTSTIASGTATIPATAIASGACGTAITVTATNVATTDVVTAGFAADPTATTGFLPTAMLTIVPYPTSGNANFKVCNLTSSSITPTSTTINWRVVR